MTRGTPASFDALIVGAGPAGAATAIQLARAGWSVALVEAQRFPRRKVCGECIAASNLPLLHRLGVGAAVLAQAGPDLRRVSLLQGGHAVTAALPAAADHTLAWGRALGRETLDSLLLQQAREAGATVFQPWALAAAGGSAGAWQCTLRSRDSAPPLNLQAQLVVDAHGSWEGAWASSSEGLCTALPEASPVGPPSARMPRPRHRRAADLFAFKANFSGTALATGAISVLALHGGYGGMVVADAGLATLACCVRRDRLRALRAATPGLRAGDAVQAWLQRSCAGVREALQGAQREGPWLASGPLAPGRRIAAGDAVFRVGNAAGEAHPILGEGISMALQSAALLCSQLLGSGGAAAVPDGPRQRQLQQRYAAAWQQEFGPRLRLACAFAQLAMLPWSAALLLRLAQAWPGLLTQGARWGDKVRIPATAGSAWPAGPTTEEPR